MRLLIVALSNPLCESNSTNQLASEWIWLDRLCRGTLSQMLHRFDEFLPHAASKTPYWVKLQDSYFEQVIIFENHPSAAELKKLILTVTSVVSTADSKNVEIWQWGGIKGVADVLPLTTEKLRQIVYDLDSPLGADFNILA